MRSWIILIGMFLIAWLAIRVAQATAAPFAMFECITQKNSGETCSMVSQFPDGQDCVTASGHKNTDLHNSETHRIECRNMAVGCPELQEATTTAILYVCELQFPEDFDTQTVCTRNQQKALAVLRAQFCDIGNDAVDQDQ